MKPQYERTSWGWIAYALIDGRLCRGRGATKTEALIGDCISDHAAKNRFLKTFRA